MKISEWLKMFLLHQGSKFPFVVVKEEEEEDLNDREVDDEDEEGEFKIGWFTLGTHALTKTE